MIKFLRRYIAVLVIFLWYSTSLQAQNPTMDAQWTVITNNGTILKLELGIRTNTSSENLGPAQFVFSYDNTYLSYSTFDWQSGFGPGIYTGGGTGVTEPSAGHMVVTLDFTSGTGTTISTSSFTPVVDITFGSITNTSGSTTITWDMNISGGTLSDVEDDGFNNFDVGTFSDLPVNPLPIFLQNFSAELEKSGVLLSWSTASEINNNYFTIERSSDGYNFVPLQQVQGAGNSEIKREYSAYDPFPLPGISYYRLSQTDFNGASQIFNIVAINNTNPDSKSAKIISTPIVSGTASLCYYLPEDGPITLMVTDINSKIIYKKQVNGRQGINTYQLSDSHAWKPGIYLISFNFRGHTTSAKMVVP